MSCSGLLCRFPFIEPPLMSSIENSVVFLKEQGAISADEKLTTIGTMLSRQHINISCFCVLCRFPFIESPSMSSIENLIVLLKEQNAITALLMKN